MGRGKHLVGVDVGTTSVKVCQLKETRRGLSLVRLGFAQLAPQVVVDGQVMDSGTIIETLQRIFRDCRIRQRECAVSVSGQNVIIRKITVPMMTEAELDEQIQWEAEQHIPFDIKDVQVDYQVLRRRPEASQMDLLLVAAKREQIEDFAQLMRAAKLKPIVCEIDAFSVQNLFEHTRGLPADRNIALIDIGATLSSLSIISAGVREFTRVIASGGNVITDEIQRALNIPHEQAEAYKCVSAMQAAVPAGDVPEQVSQVIEAVADSIAAEIQRSLDFFMATSGEGEISRIYLTGGTASIPVLSQAVERRTRIQTEVWSPTEKVNLEGNEVDLSLVQRHGAQLSVALGLALRKEKEART